MADNLTFAAPGPGFWQLDRSHYYGGATAFAQRVQVEPMQHGMARVFRELGVPAETLQCAFVNGFMYTRLRPLIGGDKPPKKLPPLFVLRLVGRLHPAMRARAKAAARTFEERPWRTVIRDWHTTIRPRIEQRNLAFQDVDLRGLDDEGLARHLQDLVAWTQETFELHFWLHGYDLGPLGRYVEACGRWGIPASDALQALRGASPSTAAPAVALRDLRTLVAATGTRPADLHALRALSPEIAAKLDAYLRLRGSMLLSRYDVDGVTLGELPNVVLSTILDSLDTVSTDDAAAEAATAAAGLRARVAEADRAEFDQCLADAREAMDLRDDNGPLTAEWPLGLLHLGLLELGRRLHDAGRVEQVEHVFELTPEEAIGSLRGDSLPSPSALAARAKKRAAVHALDPPQSLGDPEPAPPLDALPAPLARSVRLVQAVLTQMGMQESERTEALRGTGIGTTSYRGIARQARSPEDAVASMEPGDILVVPTTTPAYNVVLSLAGAVVTAEGGPMCHAAVLARELGIPAIVGAPGALRDIPDGAEVEVDAVAGVVRVVDADPATV